MVDVMEYTKRKDGKVGDKWAFYKDPSGYESNFMPYAKANRLFYSGSLFMEMEHLIYLQEKMLNTQILE